MNDRLKHIYSKIKPGAGVLDVGTDHGYIPISLASDGYPGRIFASDINELPLSIARANAEKNSVSEKIEFILADGIEPFVLQAVDTVVIAGMGGDTICHILDNAYDNISAVHTFYLQPMSKQEILRYWLVNNGFEISEESAVYDNDRLYQLITARLTGKNSCLSDTELFTGPVRLIKESGCFADILDIYIRKFERISKGSGDKDTISTYILADLKRMLSEDL